MDLGSARPQGLLRGARTLLQAQTAPRIARLTVLALSAALAAGNAAAAVLTPAAAAAWERYYRWADARAARPARTSEAFLFQDRLPPARRSEIRRRLASGETYVDRVTGVVPENSGFSLPDAEIHHWWGTVLVPHTKLAQLLDSLQDYDRHAGKFADVARSRLLSREGSRFVFSLRLKRTKAFVSAAYNTIQEAVYYAVDSRRAWSRSVATRIAEIENADTPGEREKPPGEDSGYLWRLVSWWRFEETGDGVVVEIESASLSRDIPFVVKLIPGVSAYIRSTPKDSMESVLADLRRNFAGRR